MGQKKRKVHLLFLFVYVIFALILAYLFFWNFGLEFTKQETDTGTTLFIGNNSLHSIRDVELTSNKGAFIQNIDRLLPGETQVIQLQSFEGSKIVANAPFHLQAELILTSGQDISSLGAPKLSYSANFPTPTFVDETFEVGLNICNSGTSSATVEVTPIFDAAFFLGITTSQSSALDQDQCKTLTFEFTPKKTGVSLIQFTLEHVGGEDKIPINVEISQP